MFLRRIGPASPESCDGGQHDAASPRKIVSVHFPKAAGTSLRKQFVALLGDAVYTDYGHDPLTAPGAKAVAFPEGRRVVHGHFRADRYVCPDAYLITFLREPVDNLISTYFYWRGFRKPGNELMARFLRDKPSLVEFATYPGIQRLMSETYFGGFDMERFDFIGFHETRDRDIHALASVLNLDLDASIRDNKTRATIGRLWTAMDRNTIKRVKHHLVDDIDFYNRTMATRGNSSRAQSHIAAPAALEHVALRLNRPPAVIANAIQSKG